MSARTWQALSISFHSGLLTLDQNRAREIYPGRKSLPVAHTTDDVRVILGAARRVGHAIAEMSVVQLAATLNIRF